MVASLELAARRQINTYDPFADGVFHALPNQFRYDPLGSLALAIEEVARLPLLDLVWRFVDEVMAEFGHLRQTNPQAGYAHTLSQLSGMTLGAHGNALFMAAFTRRWFTRDNNDELSEVEERFVDGDSIPGNPRGVLSASGALYMDSIWPTAFRLIERKGTEYFPRRYEDRLPAVWRILDGGAQRGAEGKNKYHLWPGWPEF